MQAGGYVSSAQQAARATDKITGAAKNANRSMSTMRSTVMGVGTAMVGVWGAQKVFRELKDTVRAYSDLEESVNAVEKTFKGASGTIFSFGETAAEAAGLAQSEVNELAVVTGSLLQNFGMSASDAADETVRLQQRASDMASVFNTEVPDAMTAVEAALRGQSRPIRRYGVSLDDMMVKQHAVKLGLAATTGEVGRNEKAMATLDLIYAQTASTAGDFADTSDDLANKTRIFAAKLENAKARIGEGLAPSMDATLDVGIELIPVIEELGVALGDLVDAAEPIVKLPAWLLAARREAKDFGRDLSSSGSALGETWGPVITLLTTSLPQSLSFFKEQLWKLPWESVDAGTESLQEQSQEWRNNAWAAQGAAQAGREVVESEEEQAAALDALAGPYREYNALMKYGVDGNEDLAGAVDDTTSAYKAQKSAVQEAARAQREASDPVFAAIRAQERLVEAQEAYDKAVADSRTTDSERIDALLDLIEAQGDADYASAVLSSTLGTSVEAFRAMAEAAGIAKADIDLLIESMWGIPSEINTDINIRYNSKGTPIGETGMGGFVAGISGPGGRAAGGPVESGTPYVVGEQGRELFIPNSSGRIVPNHALGQRSVSVTVERVETDDLPGDVAEGLFAAGVAEQVDLIGAY